MLLLLSCNNYDDNKIIELLQSSQKEDVIKGTFLAGENGDKKFIPYLLDNMNDVRTSTNLYFKGYNVYQQKMIALRKILKVPLPVDLTSDPDSVIINFYIKKAN